MAERLNDFLRACIGAVMSFAGRLALAIWQHRVRGYAGAQKALARRYRIEATTPIHSYEASTERIAAVRQSLGKAARDALTSGSTREPKRLVYTKARLRMAHVVFSETYARLAVQLAMRRTSFFVFSPLSNDSSLTSLMLDNKPAPRLLLLQTPQRIQGDPAIAEAAKLYGDTAVRFWILINANPGMLYATNPSTLATFFSELFGDWEKSRGLVRALVEDPKIFEGRLTRAGRSISSIGANARLRRVATSRVPLAVAELFPGLSHFCCWDGGYVRSFLDQVRRFLPASAYGFIPMYSMSTETIETVTCLEEESFRHLPIAPGVVYEFLPEAAADLPQNLLEPAALEPGSMYSMVVSDAYGLVRYQTEDLFRCEKVCNGLPDLRFVRRRNLSYSFTGEKLTGEQLLAAFARTKAELPMLDQTGFLSCIPSHPDGELLPHYKIVWIHQGEAVLPYAAAEICSRVQADLCASNSELAAKIESGRLGPLRLVAMPLREFVRTIAGEASPTWEAQFKFLPLYRKRWEELSR
jgi:GH3 auxin-responsive promoter